MTRDFVVAMIEQFKAQKLIHRRFAFQILLEVRIALLHNEHRCASTLYCVPVSLQPGTVRSNAGLDTLLEYCCRL